MPSSGTVNGLMLMMIGSCFLSGCVSMSYVFVNYGGNRLPSGEPIARLLLPIP